MPGPKVLSFDAVGALIDFESGLLAYLRTHCGAAAAAHDDDTILAAYRRARARPHAIGFPDDLEPLYRNMAPELGLPDDAAIAKGFPGSVAHWPAFPGSVSALQRLAARYRLVAMTNARRWAAGSHGMHAGRPGPRHGHGRRSPVREARPEILCLHPRRAQLRRPDAQ